MYINCYPVLYESFIWTLAEFRAAKLIIIFEKLYIQSGDFYFLLTNHSPYATKLASIWNVKELYTTKNKIFILMKKITALYTDFEKKRVAGSEASREQMRAERQELDKQVSAVLTDTQKAKLDEMRKARRSGGFRGKKEGK